MSRSKGESPELEETALADAPDSGAHRVAFAQTAAGDTPSRLGPGLELQVGGALGRYELLNVLGRGGMGVVYAARDPDLDRKVAVKVLRDGGAQASEDARARLLREARAMARLNHPNVITVHEVGTAGGIDFVAMELIEGGTLSSWFAEKRRPWRDVVTMFLGAGSGLVAAHRAGLVHRDFKPDNVLITAGGRAVVTDFGLARPPRAHAEAVAIDPTAPPDQSQYSSLDPLTRVGAITGTPAYMAPEQHAGLEADERSDQFSFCVALYEGLFGERPFGGDSLESLRAQVESGSVEVPRGRATKIPSRLRRAVLRGLAPKRDDRHASMDALLRELKKALSRRRRRISAFAALTATGAAALTMLLGDLRGSSLCDARGQLSDVWNSDVERSLAASLAGDPSAELAIPTISRYASAWEASYDSMCRGAHDRGEIAEGDYVLARRCLMDRRQDLRALVTTLMEGDAGSGQRAAHAAQALPPLAHCDDLESLRAGIAPPADDETRAVVDSIRETLSSMRALLEAGRAHEADERFAQLIQRAKQVEYAPVLAEALHLQGEIKTDLSQLRAAREALSEASFLAEVEGYHSIQMRALIAKLDLESRYSSNYHETLRLADRARASVSRHARDGRVEARLHRALARLYSALDRYDEAEAALEQALAGYRREDGERSVRAALTLSELAELSERRGRIDEAAALSRQALDEARRSLGPDHPRALELARVHARHLQLTGRYREARELYDEADALARAADFSEPRQRRSLSREEVREVTGRVVDARGEPVVGAEVVIGEALLGDGVFAFGDRGEWIERFHIRRAVADDDGRFSFDDVQVSELAVLAEHDDHGRSMPARIPAGETHEGEAALVLEPFGGLAGEILIEGDAPALLTIVAVPETEPPAQAQFAAYAMPGEPFSFERLAAGPYTVFVLAQTESDGMTVVWQTEEGGLFEHVRPDEVTWVTFRIDRSGSDVRATVVDADGDHVPFARVRAFEYEGDLVPSASSGMLREAIASPGRPAVLPSLAPGRYSLCARSYPIDYRDPEAAAELRAIDAELPRTCQVVEVGGARDHDEATEIVIDSLPSLRELRAAAARAPESDKALDDPVEARSAPPPTEP